MKKNRPAKASYLRFLECVAAKKKLERRIKNKLASKARRIGK
jgi:hypothetical protein